MAPRAADLRRRRLIFLFLLLDSFADQIGDVSRFFLVVFKESRIVLRIVGGNLYVFLAFGIRSGALGGGGLVLGFGRLFERDHLGARRLHRLRLFSGWGRRRLGGGGARRHRRDLVDRAAFRADDRVAREI